MKIVRVKVGNITLARGLPVAVQSMCNTPTSDIDGSYRQCVALVKAGADIIRLTTQGIKEVECLSVIKKRLRENGMSVPLVADVHFSSKVALEAAFVADKVRINPGNFSRDHLTATEEFMKLTDICKKHNTAIRIGINHGSLGERITALYGNSAEGMKEAAIEWIKIAENSGFHQIVFSLKASNTLIMTRAYMLLNESMISAKTIYPLHLGVTEAGNGDEGRIKSAVGIATLLEKGIGETIRVSLTEDPVNEIPVARFIASLYSRESFGVVASGNSKPVEDKGNIIHREYSAETREEFILKAACELGPMLLEKRVDDFTLSAKIAGVEAGPALIEGFRDNLLQATRRKFVKPEYIACPGCGRTLFNLQKVFDEVKERTAHLKGYNIAVMGCIVNGPGEMADADYGYVGEGKNKVTIYRGKTPVLRSVDEKEAIDKLLELINSDARNKLFRPRSG